MEESGNRKPMNGPIEHKQAALPATESKPARLMSFHEIVEGRYFVVPDYQRGYSWEKEQLADLKEDIENLIGSEHKHFTGTLVAAINNPGHPDTFEIVDGQQRLTSITILISQIIQAQPEKYGHLREAYIERGTLGAERLVLEPNRETRQFYKNLVIDNFESESPEIKSHENIKTARIFFRKWIKKLSEQEIGHILDIATNRLGFIFFTPAYDKEIGIMFEVINNRGKSLSQLEKIKNYLIYWSAVQDKPGLRQSINDNWIRIQENLSRAGKTSNTDEDSFLRYSYIVYFDPSKEKSHYVYDQLKERFPVKEKAAESVEDHTRQIIQFIQFLTNASRHYKWFFLKGSFLQESGKTETDHQIDKTLSRLRCHPAIASVMPLYLALMDRLDAPHRVAPLLELLEKLNFRVYVLPKITARADSKQGDLFWFAYEFHRDKDWRSENDDPYYTAYNHKRVKGDIFDWLNAELVEFIKFFCPQKKFVQALTLDWDEAEDYYRWPGLRFFLGSYEEYLQKGLGKTFPIDNILISAKDKGREKNDQLTMEHVWASKNRVEDFPENYYEKRRLGNFVLLGHASNASLGKGDIAEKIEELRDYNSRNKGALLMVHVSELTDKIFQTATERADSDWKRKTKNYYNHLSAHINDLRETRLIRFALQRWQVSGEKTSFFTEVDSFKNRSSNTNYYIQDEKA